MCNMKKILLILVILILVPIRIEVQAQTGAEVLIDSTLQILPPPDTNAILDRNERGDSLITWQPLPDSTWVKATVEVHKATCPKCGKCLPIQIADRWYGYGPCPIEYRCRTTGWTFLYPDREKIEWGFWQAVE